MELVSTCTLRLFWADYPVALWRATGSTAHVEEMNVLAQNYKGFQRSSAIWR